MRQMRGASWVLVAATFVVAACGKGGESTPPSTTATAETTGSAPKSSTSGATSTGSAASSAAPPADDAKSAAEAEKAGKAVRGQHRHHHHGGVASFINLAIDTLGLPPEKKEQVEKIQKELHAKLAPSREAGHAVLALLADGVAAGKFDEPKLKAAIAKQEAASAKVHEATIEALDKLHAALSPAERSALVEKVKAHAEVWKKVSHEEERGSKEATSHLGELTKELSLKPEEVEKISAALKKDAPPKADTAALDAHIKAFEAAFVAEKFDAKTLTTANEANKHIAKFGTERLVHFYKTITPLLTPEQRTKLAEIIRERLKDPHAEK